jgi:hypothetical protein
MFSSIIVYKAAYSIKCLNIKLNYAQSLALEFVDSIKLKISQMK